MTLPTEEGPEKSLKQVEAAFLLQALKRNGGNRVVTARQLGIHKTTLYRRLKSLGVALPPKNGGQNRN